MRNRWTVLAAGTLAQATYSAIFFAVAVMAPALRHRFGLTLGETGILLSAASAGSVVTLIPWGLATDRAGERLVLVTGLGACGAALAGAAWAGGFWSLLTLLVLAGLLGASVQSASGRAVMAWFPGRRRGLALGIRQTAVPLAGFVVSLALPGVVRAGGLRWGFLGLGLAVLAAAVLGGLVLHEGPAPAEEDAAAAGATPLRDPRLWRLSVGSGLAVAPQVCVLGFAVLLLHEHRGLSTGRAAGVLAAAQLLGVGARIAAGQWSDVVGSRLRPFRTISLVVAVLAIGSALLLDAPLAVFLPVLVVTAVLSMSWNGLSFAAAVELAGHRRSGAAIGLQQTLLAATGAVYPALFGILVASTSWAWALALLALLPLAAFQVLRALPG